MRKKTKERGKRQKKEVKEYKRGSRYEFARFREMKIGKKLTAAFAAVAVIASLSGIVGGAAMFYMVDRYDYTLINYGFSQRDIGNAMVAFADARSAIRALLGYTDKDSIRAAIAVHDDKKALCMNYMEGIKSNLKTEEEKAAYADAETAISEYWQEDEKIIRLANNADERKSEEAGLEAAQTLDPLYDQVYGNLSALMNINVRIGNDLSNNLSVLNAVLLAVIAAAIVASFILAYLLGKSTAKKIAGPLQEMGKRLATFSQGELSEEFPVVDSRDEVADMAEAAKSMAQNLTMIIQDMKNSLGKMAAGDYTAESGMGEKYVGEFGELHTAVRMLNVQMNETLRGIEEVSGQVSEGSANLSSGAQNLAEGAVKQAETIEELFGEIANISAGMEHILAAVEKSYDESQQYAQEAERSRQEMQSMMDIMHGIDETSKKIGSIIGEIEEIASQTNLLSLNASIEAARAGEAGRGFAVVADQIGKLADESAKSAVHTRAMITNSLKEIAAGCIAAEAASDTIDGVVQGINSIALKSKNISEMSRQQVETVVQVKEKVDEISKVVQDNSATAEETSATSEELSAQALMMDELVKKFVLK